MDQAGVNICKQTSRIDEKQSSGPVEGTDTDGTTAAIAVEAARRLNRACWLPLRPSSPLTFRDLFPAYEISWTIL
jgi:hypothetical protein